MYQIGALLARHTLLNRIQPAQQVNFKGLKAAPV